MSRLKEYFNAVPEGKRDSGAIAYLAALDEVGRVCPEVAEAVVKELKDQREHLKLIASENYSSLAVQLAMGNLLTDKYAEGYPFHRFYAGCDNVDAVEGAAVKGAKELFGADHAYVQPHSGADANLVAFWAILIHRIQDREMERLGKKRIGDLTDEEYENVRQMLVNQKVMGMSLSSGGHLTHGYRLNVSAKFMKGVSYDVDPKSHLIDYGALAEQVKREKPLILIAGYSAYPRKIDFAKMREIADSVGATLMVDMAHFAGLVAGKVFTGVFDPIPHADVVTTTTHKTLRGPRGGMVLCSAEYGGAVDKGCPMILGGPLPHVMAAKAVAFKEASGEAFRTYAHQVVANAQALSSALRAGGAQVITGGTDNHIVLVDVAESFGMSGMEAEKILREAGMTVNRNTIPFDPKGPWHTSGVRMGTPAITSRGMKENEMKVIGRAFCELLKGQDPKVTARIRGEIDALLQQFPLYPEIAI